jgi:hypothetical protein
MQTNIARAADYDQPHAAGAARTTILIVDDDATARTRRQYQNLMREGS